MAAQTRTDRLREWGTAAVFAAGLLLFWLTRATGVVPGEPAAYLTAHLGLEEFIPLNHPLWGLLVDAARWLAPRHEAAWLNAASGVFGALALALVFRIGFALAHDRTWEETVIRHSAPLMALLSGLGAALWLAACVPFWLVATRAHPATLDVCLMLGVIALVMRYTRRPSGAIFLATALLSGLAVAEFATFLVLAPPLAGWLLYAAWKNGRLRPGLVLGGVLLFALGAGLSAWSAWRVWSSPSAHWRLFESCGQVWLFFWRDQLALVVSSVPRFGWLLIGLTCFVPGLAALVPKRASFEKGGLFGSYLLHVVLLLVSFWVLYNLNGSPWPRFGWNPLLVTPYVFTALWSGYVLGYWLILAGWQDRVELPPLAHPLPVRLQRAGAAILLAAGLGAALAHNAAIIREGSSRALAFATDQLLSAPRPPAWLMTDGMLDAYLLACASERQAPLRVLNLRQAGNPAYRNHIAAQFEDPRMKGLAQVSFGAFLSEWLGNRTETLADVATLESSDLWLALGYQPVPWPMTVKGVTNGAAVNCAALLAEYRAFWTGLAAALQRDAAEGRASDRWSEWAWQYASRRANNLGVFFEDMGRGDLAPEAYRRALAFETNNLSALANLAGLLQRARAPGAAAAAAAWQSAWKTYASRGAEAPAAEKFGVMRSSEALARAGRLWASFGRPEVAVAQVRRALDLGGERQPLELSLAQLYYTQGLSADSARVFEDVLKKDPTNQPALNGLLQIALVRRDAAQARALRDRLAAQGVAPEALREMDAMLAVTAGRTNEAAAIWRSLLRDHPDNQRAAVALGWMALQTGDARGQAEMLSVLEKAESFNGPALFLRAILQAEAGRPEKARASLNLLLRNEPANASALELSLRLDVARRDLAGAERRLEGLLTADPANAFGNWLLGNLQIRRREYALAENSLRRSLARRRSVETLNDLAWVLRELKRPAEGLEFAQEAVRLDAANPAALDTLGLIRLALNRPAEARADFEQALKLTPREPELRLHLAQALARTGDAAAARALLDELAAHPAELPPGLRDDIQRSRKELP